MITYLCFLTNYKETCWTKIELTPREKLKNIKQGKTQGRACSQQMEGSEDSQGQAEWKAPENVFKIAC